MTGRYAVLLGIAAAIALVGLLALSAHAPAGVPAAGTPTAGPAQPTTLLPHRLGPETLQTLAAEPGSRGTVADRDPDPSGGGAGVRRVDPKAASTQIAGYLLQADRPAEVLSMAGAIAGDPEMRALLRLEAEELRRSADGRMRARGTLILAGLGIIGPEEWQRDLLAENDPEARTLLVKNAPIGRDAEPGGTAVEALLSVAHQDDTPSVRQAAIDALPDGLSAAGLSRLVTVLQQDADPQVRETAARYFRGAERSEMAVVRGLLAVAESAHEATGVRRQAIMALYRIEERHPGTLAGAGRTAEDLGRMLHETSNDAG